MSAVGRLVVCPHLETRHWTLAGPSARKRTSQVRAAGGERTLRIRNLLL